MSPNRSSRPRSLRTHILGSGKPRESNRPPSPTFSDTTNVSNFAFGPNGPQKIITRNDLKSSVQAYEDLMGASTAYRDALVTMSNATFAFADAMQACSLLKGASYEAATRLQVSSGLHHLIGNQWLVLAQALDKKFEKPLKQHLDSYKTIIRDRSASYEKALREKSHIIRDTESRNLHRKERNLQTFREALVVLQRQVDELDELKASHYTEIMEHEEEVWNIVQNKTCVVVRSEMDVFDKFVSKSSDPVIEPMLLSVPDPFDSYGPPQSEDHIFSILGPLSITPRTSVSAAATLSPPNSGPPAFHDPIPSWLASTDHQCDPPDHSTNIGDGHGGESESERTTPRSASPPTPTSSSFTKSHGRKDSKMKSVLSVIDEQQHQHQQQGSSSSSITYQAAPSPSPWASSENHHDDFGVVVGERTPRNSTAVYDDTDNDNDNNDNDHNRFENIPDNDPSASLDRGIIPITG